MYIALQFLAIVAFVNGIIGFGLHYFFQLGSHQISFSIGSAIAIVIIYLLLLLLFIVGILKWLKYSVFKNKTKNKWLEFIQIWLVCTLMIGLFTLVIYMMPSFGPVTTIPTVALAGIGILLYLVSKLFK